jgi:hypothetical protein
LNELNVVFTLAAIKNLCFHNFHLGMEVHPAPKLSGDFGDGLWGIPNLQNELSPKRVLNAAKPK